MCVRNKIFCLGHLTAADVTEEVLNPPTAPITGGGTDDLFAIHPSGIISVIWKL